MSKQERQQHRDKEKWAERSSSRMASKEGENGEIKWDNKDLLQGNQAVVSVGKWDVCGRNL